MSVFQIHAKDTVVRVGGIYGVVNGVQNVSWDPAMNVENLMEIGNKGYAGRNQNPSVSASFDSTSTGSTVALLKRMIKSFDASGEFLGYLAGAVATADNVGLIRETDLEHACFDFLIQKQPDEIFDRTELLSRIYLSSLALSANADGTASESYSFEGEVGDVYRTPYHDLQVIPLTRTAGSDTILQVPMGYDVSLDATGTYQIFELNIDGRTVAPAAMAVALVDPDAVVASGDEYQTITLTGYTAPLGAKLGLVVYRNIPGTFPTIEYPTAARFIKAEATNIYLINKVTLDIEAQLDLGTDLNTLAFSDNDLFLRVQSADISLDLQREELRELRKNDRGTSVFHRAATYPMGVTSSITTYETDLKDWQKLQGKADGDILDLKGFEGQEWQIVQQHYYNDAVVQTNVLLDGVVAGRGSSVAVSGRNEISWSFEGSKVAIEGSATV